MPVSKEAEGKKNRSQRQRQHCAAQQQQAERCFGGVPGLLGGSAHPPHSRTHARTDARTQKLVPTTRTCLPAPSTASVTALRSFDAPFRGMLPCPWTKQNSVVQWDWQRENWFVLVQTRTNGWWYERLVCVPCRGSFFFTAPCCVAMRCVD